MKLISTHSASVSVSAAMLLLACLMFTSIDAFSVRSSTTTITMQHDRTTRTARITGTTKTTPLTIRDPLKQASEKTSTAVNYRQLAEHEPQPQSVSVSVDIDNETLLLLSSHERSHWITTPSIWHPY
eukprot:516804_1